MDGKLESEEAVQALAALAQASRLAIFRLLVRQGPAGISAGKIAKLLAIPLATLSFHLQQLSQAGLVCSRRKGRYIIYTANYQKMNTLVHYLNENCCQGIDASDRCSENLDAENSSCNRFEEIVK